jgi:hypothetical protein
VQDYPTPPAQVDLDSSPQRSNFDARIIASSPVLTDRRLTYGARGLAAVIASYPHGVTLRTLRKRGPEPLPKLREMLDELRALGYVEGGEL